MSGPWDRPSQDRDADWPAEDLEAPRTEPSETAPPDAWSSGDLWPEPSRDASPGWDEWPSPAPPPSDDYVVDEPAATFSDPWAESWADEAAAQPPDSWTREPEPSPPVAPAPADSFSPPPLAEPDPRPRIEPWSPDLDPWGVDVHAPEPAPADEPEPDWRVEPVRPDADLEPAPTAEPLLAPERDPAPAFEPEPIVEPEPEPEAGAEMEPEPEPLLAAEPEPEPIAGAPSPDHPPLVTPAYEPEPIEPEPIEVGPIDPEPIEPEPIEPEPARAGPVDYPPLLAPEPEPDDVESEPSWPDDQPVTVSEWETDAEAPSSAVWGEAVDPWAAIVQDAPPSVEEPEQQPIASSWPFEGEPVDEPEPASAWAADRLAPREPEEEAADDFESIGARPSWLDDDLGRGESTQVLPATWEPPPPPAPVREDHDELAPIAGPVQTRLATTDPDLDEEAEPDPSTAEQAVPWLIGFILLLAGMVIVLLALIFAGDESLGGAGGSTSPTLAALPIASTAPSPTPSASAPVASTAPRASVAPTPTPIPIPEYGPLEMVYQGRSAPLAPIYLLHRDFTVAADPEVLAQDPSLDVRRFAWARDGTVGVGLYEDVLVSIEPGAEKRRLGEGISTVTFGNDVSTVYAVRVTQDGANDVATILQIDFVSGDTVELATVSYPRPQIGDEGALEEAQFADEGGTTRLYWMDHDVLRLWSLGAGTWEIAPEDGAVTELEEALPTLWAPDGRHRIGIEHEAGTTTLSLLSSQGQASATTTVEGMVSHVRWSPSSKRVVFTVGRSTSSGGGVLQNLFLWDLGDGQEPMPLTDTGAAFGAEWLGTMPVWRD